MRYVETIIINTRCHFFPLLHMKNMQYWQIYVISVNYRLAMSFVLRYYTLYSIHNKHNTHNIFDTGTRAPIVHQMRCNTTQGKGGTYREKQAFVGFFLIAGFSENLLKFLLAMSIERCLCLYAYVCFVYLCVC